MTSINPLLLPIQKDSDTIRKVILTNIVKMLTTRNCLDRNNIDDNIETITSTVNDNNIYYISLDGDRTNENIQMPKENSVAIKLLNQKITGVTKSPLINEFLSAN